MRLKHIKGAEEFVAASPYCQAEDSDPAGTWAEIFGNDNPVYIEIGMGKGNFILEQARRNPDINYVGIEKYSSVLIKALWKREKREEYQIENIRFIRMDAENIGRYFGKDEVAKIFLNFSDPWPKDRHAKRRLTSKQFLKRYEGILKKDGLVEFKTDNNDLFDFSLEQVEEAGWDLLAVTRDLHNDPVLNEGNIMTEYEAKFSAEGQSINKMIIRQK